MPDTKTFPADIIYDSAIDDAVCLYEYETLKARGLMTLIRRLDDNSLLVEGAVGAEPTLRAILGAAKSFEKAAARMCKRIRDAEAKFHDATTPGRGA